MAKIVSNDHGSVLVEALLCLLIVMLVLIFNLELARRAQYEWGVHHASCLWVRFRALGMGVRQADRRTEKKLRSVLGDRLTFHFEDLGEPGEQAKVHTRFKGLISLPRKHHFEITKRCRFFY